MILTEEQKQAITNEYNQFVKIQYAGKTKKERQELGQFFTPSELTIRMIEKFTNLEGTILDPTCGAGGCSPLLYWQEQLQPSVMALN